jgi:hypothetical protein
MTQNQHPHLGQQCYFAQCDVKGGIAERNLRAASRGGDEVSLPSSPELARLEHRLPTSTSQRDAPSFASQLKVRKYRGSLTVGAGAMAWLFRTTGLKTVIVAVVLATCVSTEAWAWGPLGHNIIAQTAYQRLPPALRTKLDLIRQRGNGLLYEYTDDDGVHACSAWSLNDYANWADCVRYGGVYSKTYNEHFDDIPYCPKFAPLPPKPSYCEDNICATTALQRYIAQLSAADTSDRDRAAALAFIIHLAGDLHQPLHTIDNAKDHGGNGVRIEIAPASPGGTSTTTKLHKVWDGPMVRWVYSSQSQGVSSTKSIAAKLGSGWVEPSMDEATFTRWSAESHEIAIRAYNEVSPAPVCNVTNDDLHRIDQNYFGKFYPEAQLQLAKAAVRLSQILEDALAAAPD